MAKAEEKISKAKSKLLLSQSFYGVLLTSTNITEDSKNFKTMATNGVEIFWNREFVEKLSDPECTGVLLHEVNHIILFHCDPKRKGSRTQDKWNQAVDYAVNEIIYGMGYQLPKEALMNHDWSNLSAEQIYDKLEKDKSGGPGKIVVHGSGSGVLDDHISMPGDSITKNEIEGKIIAAVEATKDKGTLPAGIERWIKELRDNKVDWRTIFRNFIGSVMSKSDYNWYPPDRRFIGEDLYMPSLSERKIGHICVAFDTSGSIGQREINQFTTEVKTIQTFVEEITCMTCDAAVHEVVKVSCVENFAKKLKFKGGGGTSFIPVFDMIRKKNIQPECLIYLTDGYGDYPLQAPPYPLLWVLTPNHQNPPEHLGMRVEMKELSNEVGD